MAIVKLTKEQYPNRGDVIKLAYYIANPMKCVNTISGGKNIITAGSFFCDPESVAAQFLAIQHGQRFERRLYHVIINFDSSDQVNVTWVYQIGMAVCNMYSDYQSAFAIHEDKDIPHIHIMLNNCPIPLNKPKLTAVINPLNIQEMVDSMINHKLGLPVQR